MKRSNKNKSVRNNSTHSFGKGLESLETRQMFSASPLDFYTVGNQLVCDLTGPSEQVSVVRSANGIQFNVNGQIENVAGNFSYLSVIAQSGPTITCTAARDTTICGRTRTIITPPAPGRW